MHGYASGPVFCLEPVPLLEWVCAARGVLRVRRSPTVSRPGSGRRPASQRAALVAGAA